jgi:Peptidase family S41
MPQFKGYIGIDYSGAATAESHLKEIRVYAATASVEPYEVTPSSSAGKYWSRRGVANWLREQLLGEDAVMVGIDHGFSLPLTYFKRHGLRLDWSGFLDEFQRHCPTDQEVYVLASKRTFSGAEEFCYNLKQLKQATIVGETTGGGAHPVAGQRIDDHFMIGVPFARAINPISKTNWEGTGVEPDVKVPASEALAKAQKLEGEKLASK